MLSSSGNINKGEGVMKTKPVVGQVLYSLNVGNAARNCGQVLTPVTVVSVGRKYFKVKKDVNAPKWC